MTAPSGGGGVPDPVGYPAGFGAGAPVPDPVLDPAPDGENAGDGPAGCVDWGGFGSDCWVDGSVEGGWGAAAAAPPPASRPGRWPGGRPAACPTRRSAFLALPGGIPSHDTLGRAFALPGPDESRR